MNWRMGIFLVPLMVFGCGESGTKRYYEFGQASFYGDGFDGNQTANGEIFDKNALTAAHKSLPFDSIVIVTEIPTGNSVTVRINDRGPFIEGRIIDLSERAAADLGIIDKGVTEVQIVVQ